MHPAIKHVLQFFDDYEYLPDPLNHIGKEVHEMALGMASALPENQEVTVGLRKLLEARDWFFRAAMVKE